MKFRESISLLKKDRVRNVYSRWRYFYDPILMEIAFFRMSCGTPFLVRIPSRLALKLLSYILGIQLTPGTKLGGGIKIVHHGTIVITKGAVIGNNLTIHQCVTIGKNFGGTKYGYPTIGDNVII